MEKIPVIYLLGISYSGSTLLGYLLGANPKVFNAGELKQFNRVPNLRQRECTCGQTVGNCEFWKDIDFQSPRIYNKPSLSEKISGASRILRLGDRGAGFGPWGAETDDAAFFRTLQERLFESQGTAGYILDVSKSLYRLLHLLSFDQLDLRIVHIERDIRGNVASFVKYKQSFLLGLLTYKSNQLLIRRMRHRLQRPCLHVHHSNLCKNPESEFQRIGSFLGLDYSDVFEQIKDRRYHVFTGNIHTHKQFKTFRGLRVDESWRERLSPLQKRLLAWVE